MGMHIGRIIISRSSSGRYIPYIKCVTASALVTIAIDFRPRKFPLEYRKFQTF